MTTEIVFLISSIFTTSVILLAIYIMLRYFSRQNEKQFDFLKSNQDLTRLKLENNNKQEREKVVIPLRLQAFERMVLFLERINPPNLLTREVSAGDSVGSLQSKLIKSLREEYEHNMSQQLYISDYSWEQIKTAKEKVVQLVNTKASKFDANDNSIKLANEILTLGFENNIDPIENAMNAIKSEIRDNF